MNDDDDSINNLQYKKDRGSYWNGACCPTWSGPRRWRRTASELYSYPQNSDNVKSYTVCLPDDAVSHVLTAISSTNSRYNAEFFTSWWSVPDMHARAAEVSHSSVCIAVMSGSPRTTIQAKRFPASFMLVVRIPSTELKWNSRWRVSRSNSRSTSLPMNFKSFLHSQVWKKRGYA